ncbi:crotonobetainyl-CoA:carnitine CoA-transferase CaiB-like acyl-CoA transferase [Arcticibacter pallidicorallinus]|uniref:Crotonobetainyl-CoA:carnitine CoA-transferase CaiB-like acyl-CoA transferase n=1 Tax=Arcticibacter pallidicorallinus TaxID=1259464 RepID=A0A2T0U3R5_9SPHI|nr:CaiB/BaiF CoA-transferase family protein [Arcticibacter pallidicorallinus]PRY52569.1 crotonobetainyl-CoA:carnitine CoA-transferase CaiB-like acyl-CoA transferase [Arcticibacter pallidicorallinus]
MSRPLEGLLVLEFCQFLAGPSAGLKLADMGARVIKIERPLKGEAGRQLAIKNMFVEGDSLLFHTINRNKESYAADLKNQDDLNAVKELIAKADVITHNFRPGVMEKIGLDYASVKALNSRIIYATVTGYGNAGPWATKPGQDLLVQSLSGLAYLSGTADQGPVPFGLSVSDIMCGNHLTQGILAALIKRARTKQSVLVEVSLLESTLDMQFEVLTTYLNDGKKLPQRSYVKGAGHAYLSAPYGIYETADGYLALAMGDLNKIAAAIGCDISSLFTGGNSSFDRRDDILEAFSETFKEKHTKDWLEILVPLDIWCADVLDYKRAVEHPAFGQLGISQSVQVSDSLEIRTTRSPIRIDNRKLLSSKPAPKVGAHNSTLNQEFNIQNETT